LCDFDHIFLVCLVFGHFEAGLQIARKIAMPSFVALCDIRHVTLGNITR